MDPEIYVLDEPTANLDVEAIERLREQIILLKKQGRTVLIAEHRLYFIADLIDRALYFRSGQIAESFSGEEFQNLSENKRKELGLRTLNQPTISLPKARAKDDSVWNECEQAAGEIINRAEIESVLKKFDLLRLKEQHPMALSGGQKQRLAVATAMLSNKKLLIFDEPTSGLDYRHMRAVSAVIRNLAEQGHIILVVSHDNEFMTEACDRVLGI